jgi:hypothetical protein
MSKNEAGERISALAEHWNLQKKRVSPTCPVERVVPVSLAVCIANPNVARVDSRDVLKAGG